MENKPHCWGKMDWILQYPVGEEKNVCSRCEHGVQTCLRLTRENAEKQAENIDKSCNHRFSKHDGNRWVCTQCGRPDPPR